MPPKRKRSSKKNARDSAKRFAYLRPRVRQVPERTIKAKWATLPEPAQDKIRSIFRAATHPVIVRQSNERKRIEAQSAVQVFVKSLEKRLPRMVFPPATKESDFVLEAGLAENRYLEAYMATLTDSIDLLKTSIKKEEALLAREKKELQELEKNSKDARAEKLRQMKNEHPILRQLDSLPQDQTGPSTDIAIRRNGDDLADLDFTELGSDPDVQVLLKQLNGHLNSMQNNTDCLSGLQSAMNRSRSALSLYLMTDD